MPGTPAAETEQDEATLSGFASPALAAVIAFHAVAAVFLEDTSGRMHGVCRKTPLHGDKQYGLSIVNGETNYYSDIRFWAAPGLVEGMLAVAERVKKAECGTISAIAFFDQYKGQHLLSIRSQSEGDKEFGVILVQHSR